MMLNGKSCTGPAESKNLCMRGRSMLENREISEVFPTVLKSERLGKVSGYNSNANASEKSDIVVVPEKEPNKAGLP